MTGLDPRRERYAGAITDHLWGDPTQIDDATTAVMGIADTELRQAEAAVARVRSLANRIALDSGWGRQTAEQIHAALHGTEAAQQRETAA